MCPEGNAQAEGAQGESRFCSLSPLTELVLTYHSAEIWDTLTYSDEITTHTALVAAPVMVQ